MNYEGKFGTKDKEENNKDILQNLFIESVTPDLTDVDDVLDTPILSINLNEVDQTTQNRANAIATKLAAYYFDESYVQNHPYIKDKIAQEIDNIRRLLKMLAVNEKAQDTLITSISISGSKGTLYSSLTSLQNSMLSMQSQLNTLTANLENIFKEMQDNCDKTFQEKEKEDNMEDGSITVRGTRNFIQQIEAIRLGKFQNKEIVNL